MAGAPLLTSDESKTIRDRVRAAWEQAFPGAEVPASLLATERQIKAVTLAERQFSGLLVALWLEPEQAAELAIEGGEPADALHVTLAYLPDMADADDVTFARIVTALADVAALESRIEGKIGGAGCFYSSDSSDGRDVYYAIPDVPYIDYLRERVVRALGSAGHFGVPTDRAWIPHITLLYGSEGADVPMPERIDLEFTGITVVAGDRRLTIPFWEAGEGVDYAGAFPDQYNYYAERTTIKLASGRASEAWRFSSRRTFAVGDEWIQVLPPPGTYHHSIYGTLEFTDDKYGEILSNFHMGVYAQTLPVNTEHDLMTSGAIGWVTDMRRGPDGSIEVRTDWNERGKALLDDDRFRYVSAEWWDQWQDPVSGNWIDNVFSGFAICTHPHFKTDVLRPLAASEVDAFRAGATGKERIGVGNQSAEQKVPPADAAITLSESELAEFRAFRDAGGAAKITELSDKLSKLSDDNQKLQDEARQKRFTDIARGRAEGADGVAWQGNVEDHVGMLVDLAAAFGDDSDQVKRYIAQQTAQAAAFAEAMKPLMKADGTGLDVDGGPTAVERITQAASALREADPQLTQEQAFTRAYEQADPQLKRSYREERPSNRDTGNAGS